MFSAQSSSQSFSLAARAPSLGSEQQSPSADAGMGDDDEEVVDNTAKANRADMNKLGGGGGDDDGGVDSDAAKKRALEMANDDLKKEKEAEAARLKELMAVKISQEDVATIVSEIEVEKKAAEMRLREHGGDVVAALKSYVTG